MNGRWRHKRVPLEFKFCGLNLFKFPLITLELQDHFTALEKPQELSLPDLHKKQWVDCFLIPAYPIEKPIPHLQITSGYLKYSTLQYHHYYIAINGTFNDYLQKFAHKARYNLQRTVRLYNNFCKSESPWKEYSRPEDMDEFYRLASEVSEKSYQERLLDAGLPKDPGFIKKLKLLAAKNEVLGYILFYEQKAVAYVYCTIVDKKVICYAYVGYAPEYARWSPGRVLLFYVLKNLFDKGVPCTFDFTRGGGAGGHKDFFSNHSIFCTELYYFKLSLKNFFLILTHLSVNKTSQWFTRLLVFLKIKETLVRMFKSLPLGLSPSSQLQTISSS